MLGLQRLQLLEKAVVLGIRNLRRVQRVVLVRRPVQPRPQIGGMGGKVCFFIHSWLRLSGGDYSDNRHMNIAAGRKMDRRPMESEIKCLWQCSDHGSLTADQASLNYALAPFFLII